MCCTVTRVSSAWKFGLSNRRIWTALPPSSVTLLPPSITVFFISGRCIVAVTAIVTGALPQLNVITPPLPTAASSSANVQLSGVPVPTTVSGAETSADIAAAGTPARQCPSGLPFAGATDPGASIDRASGSPPPPSGDDDPHAAHTESSANASDPLIGPASPSTSEPSTRID